MTKGEAIDLCMEVRHYLTSGNPIWDKDKVGEALDMAIEALEGVCFDEWCTDCKEYDTEKNCCPRFNRVIRGAMNREPSEDGTLEVKVDDATKIGRVLISDDKHRGGLYYPDEDEPQGDLISRAEAIKRLLLFKQSRAKNVSRYDMGFVDGLSHAINILDLVPLVYMPSINILDLVSSADRTTDGDLISRADAIEALGEEPLVWCDEEYEIAERNQWRDDIEVIKSIPSADRPKGKWYYSDGKPATIGRSFGVICDQCGTESEYCTNFCGECGADMRGDTK